MKIRIERDALADAVAWTARALNVRGGGIGTGIGIETGADSIILTTYDRDTSARAEFEAVVSEPGKVMVPGRLLADISKILPAAPVVLQLNGNQIDLSCRSTSYVLPLIDGADFPAMIEMPAAIGRMKGEDFATAVGQVASSANPNDVRAQHTGVLMEFGKETISFAATDRYRLALREANYTPLVSDPSASLLPSVTRLTDIAKGLEHCDEVTIYAATTPNTNVIGFSGESKSGATYSIITNLVSATFPSQFRDLFPKQSAVNVVVNTNELLGALKRVRLVLDPSNQSGASFVSLRLGEDEITITGKGLSAAAEATEMLPAQIDNQLEHVQFNPGLLMDGLAAIDSPFVKLSFTVVNKPVVIAGMSAEDAEPDLSFQYLLMPSMRSQG